MGEGAAGSAHPRQDRDDRPIDVSRQIAALRRNVLLMVLIVVPLTAAVLVLSLILPKSYRATASLVVSDQPGLLQASDADSTRRRLATFQSLLTSRDVLARAARGLPGETAETLRKKVTVTASDASDILTVDGSDGRATGAAAIANAVTRTFLRKERDQELQRLAGARRDLEAALQRLRGTGGTAVEIRAIRERLSQLSIDEVSAGQSLALAEAARPPRSAHAPKPLENTVFAFFAATFLAVLAALVRDRLAPRVGSARELARLAGVTPLAVLPGRRPGGAEAGEAFQALQAAARLALPADGGALAVVSALPGEGRSMITAGLTRALAATGRPVYALAAALRPDGTLEVPASGTRDGTTASEFAGRDLADVLADLRDGRTYVVLDAPPLLTGIDGRLAASTADAVLVVARLDRLSPGDAEDLRAALDELGVPVLGAVVLGGHGRPSYSLGAWSPTRGGTRVPAT
jgi:capsular polysaccharide biosynthesis protein